MRNRAPPHQYLLNGFTMTKRRELFALPGPAEIR